MESSSKDNYCNGCKTFKPLSKFTRYGAKGIKKLKTCDNCVRFSKNEKLLSCHIYFMKNVVHQQRKF